MFECHVSYPQLVSRCFEPGQPQKITSGLNTNFSLSPSYSFHKSIITPQVIFAQTAAQILSTISERNTRNIITRFGADFFSASPQHGNLHPAGWLILFCQPTQEPVSATANTTKTRERTGRVEISQDEIPDSKRSVLGYKLTYSRF